MAFVKTTRARLALTGVWVGITRLSKTATGAPVVVSQARFAATGVHEIISEARKKGSKVLLRHLPSERRSGNLCP